MIARRGVVPVGRRESRSISQRGISSSTTIAAFRPKLRVLAGYWSGSFRSKIIEWRLGETSFLIHMFRNIHEAFVLFLRSAAVSPHLAHAAKVPPGVQNASDLAGKL